MTLAVSRRVFLSGAASVAAAPLLPVLPASADVTVIGVDMATGPSVSGWTMWAVGSGAESFDWRCIAADSELSAWRQWLSLTGNDPDDFSDNLSERVARIEIWDDLGPEGVKSGDWIDANMGHCCARCDCECYGGDGARNIDGEAVCEECLTIGDIIAHDRDEDVIERLADEIADRGEDGTRRLIAECGADVPVDLWLEAVRRAAA